MNYIHLRQLTKESDRNNASRSKSLLTFDKVSKVTVLFDTKDYEGVVPFITQLESQGKQVRAWSFSRSYNPAKDYKIDRSYKMFVINRHHFDGKRLLLKWVNVDFHSWGADLLIDLSHRDNPVTEYLASASRAVFKIGLKAVPAQRYELVCEVKQAKGDIYSFASQLMTYYQSIKPDE